MLIDTATLSPRAQYRLATADPAIVAFAATMPGGIAAWAEAPLLDGHGRVVADYPPPVRCAPYGPFAHLAENGDDDLVTL